MNVNTRTACVITWAVFATFAVPDIVELLKAAAQVAAALLILAALFIGVAAFAVIEK